MEDIVEKVKEVKKNQKSASGILSQYANLERIEEEKGAWEDHVVNKYRQDMAT